MKKTKGLRRTVGLILLFCLGLSLGSPVLALDNTGTVGSGTVYTDDAFYYSDQFMWKASLFVAKADTVNRTDATMADFHRIGSEAVYLSPVSDWSGWVGGNRPGNIKSMEFAKGNKVDTLQELKSKGGDANALDPVVLTNSGGVNMIPGVPNLPFPPQMCDGIINDNGVVYSEYVGNLTEVTDYFGSQKTMTGLLNYYAAQQGKSPEQLVSDLEFTINGETRKNWNPEGILPKAVAGNTADINSTEWNHVNQVEWLIVYEPCTIVYTRVTGGYKAYVMTATDFAVTQIKKQMDWRYDESRMSSWAGLQPDAWKPNGERHHVARLSHLVVGNSVIIKEGWYGLDATGNKVDQNAVPPYSRWTSEDELKYGGWGMSLWEKPKTKDKPVDYDFNANTDVIYATDIFSNIDTLPGQELTVTYEINSETYMDTVIAQHRRLVVSYFKWHTPDVDVPTSYDLKITVSPFPKGTVDGDGNEYVHRTITVRPLVEKTPADPKVLDTLPEDFIPEHVPGIVVGDDTLDVTDKAVVKSITEASSAPYYLNDVVKLEVVTNRATEWFDFRNVQSGDVRQLTPDSVGNGILVSTFENKLNDTITWTLEFTMAHFGDNVYSATPGNSFKGMGDEYVYNLKLEEDPDVPTIFSVDINPKPTEPPGFYWLYTDTKAPELKYMVIFDTDGGTEMEPLMIKANTLIPKPGDPAKEGYDFKGWYKDNNFTELWDFNTEKIKGVTTLYAKFEIKTFTVLFNHNGLGAPIAPITVPYGQNIEAPAKSVVEGHIFEGWYKDSGLTEKWNFDTDVVTSNITLHAKWKLDKFMVGFEENGGKLIADLLLDYDSLILVPTCEHEGYTLDGWFSDPGCTVLWNFGSDRIKTNMLLYAKWTANPSTIAFEENGGSEVADLVGVTDQIVIDTTMPETLRPGYRLEGWFETEDFSGAAVTQLPEKFPADGIKYYAKWKAKPSIIEFIENSGDAVSDLTGVTDQIIIDRSMPTAQRTGYTLEGWFENEDLTGIAVAQLPEKYPADGIKYYAKWKAKPSIIEFIENSGDAVPDLTGVTDQIITDRSMPTAQRTGYTLEGWFENEDLTGIAVAQLSEKYPADGIKYYAKWKAKPSVIEFIENSGDAVPDLTGVTDQIITDRSMPAAQRTGYTLEGWFENEDLTGVAVAQLPEKYPADGIKYYAKWKAKPSVIEFIENSGDAVPDLTGVTDQIITDRSMPAAQRTGYTLEGWFENEDLTGIAVAQLSEKYPADGIKYYAKWKAKPSVIEFIENSGDAVPDLTGVTDQIITDRSMPAAQRTGYTLEGWFENEDLTGVAVAQLPEKYPADGIKYYAKWAGQASTISFVENGGTIVFDLGGITGQTVANRNMPVSTKSGYAFSGWFKAEDLSGDAVIQLPELYPANGITYYAKWTISSFTVTFNSNGGTAVPSVVANYGTKIGAPTAPTKNGHTFSGWYKDAALTQVWTFTTDTATADTTLYAKWIQVYAVTLNTSGGSHDGSVYNIAAGSPYTPPSVTKAGHIFMGWYKDASYNIPWSTGSAITGNTTLYAKWRVPATITVHYYVVCGGFADVLAYTEQIQEGQSAPYHFTGDSMYPSWCINTPGPGYTIYSYGPLYTDTQLFMQNSSILMY